MKRRLLSLGLCLCLLMGLAAPAQAAEAPEEETPSVEEDASVREESPAEETPEETEPPAEEETPEETEPPAEEAAPEETEPPAEETPEETEPPAEEETPEETEPPTEEETPEEAEEDPAVLALEESFSGSCGDSLTWTLAVDGTLTISGSGAMTDYGASSNTRAPWYRYQADILTVEISDGAASIGNYAFANLGSLVTVTVPDSVKLIGVNAFDSCGSLQRVDMGKGVTGIGRAAFQQCDSLTDIVIPGGVTGVEPNAFYSCDSLKIVTICSGVASIGTSAFYYCDNLKTVYLPDSLTGIAENAFAYAGPVQDVYYGGTQDQWKQIVISGGNSNLTNASAIRYGSTVPSTPDSGIPAEEAASGTCGTNLTWRVDNEGNLSIGGTGTMFNYGTSSSTRAPWYRYGNSIKTVALASGVTGIGDYAFAELGSLIAVTVPDSVKLIGVNAFDACGSLQQVRLGSGVTGIGRSAFQNCDSLTDIVIPGGVTGVEPNAFYSCDSLKIVTICSGVASIGTSAFYYCDNLKTVYLPDSLTGIAKNAFAYAGPVQDVYYGGTQGQWNQIVISGGNSNLTNASAIRYGSTVPSTPDSGIPAEEAASGTCGTNLTWRLDNEGNLSIGGTGAMFNYGTSSSTRAPWYRYGNSIKTVALASGVTGIGDYAFAELGSLIAVTVPDSVKLIGAHAFDACGSLQQVSLGSGVTGIGESAFLNCNSLTDIVIPGGVTGVEPNAFYSCDSLKTVTICSGVASIGTSAFYYCDNLSTIYLPASLTSIAKNVFAYANGLQDVYYSGTLEQWTQIEKGDGNTVLNSAAIHYNYNPDETVAVTGVSLSQSALSLNVGQTAALRASITPSNATIRNLTWTSSNSLAATVENGAVTAVGEGSAVITVTTVDGGYTASCTVTVTAASQPPQSGVPVTGVSLNKSGLALAVGNTETLTATVAPANAGNKAVAWSSSNPAAASVDASGTVTALQEGTAVITATTASGSLTASCRVTVTAAETGPVSVTGVTLSKNTLDMSPGASATLTAAVSPTDATNQDVSWSSSNPETAEVVNGIVTAGKAGTAIITATTVDGGHTAFCTVTVTKHQTGLSITKLPAKLSYAYGEPLDTAGMEVSALYDDGSTGEVSNWTVSGYNGKASGTQSVTVKSGSFTAVFTVTVGQQVTGDVTVAKPQVSIESFRGGKRVILTAAEGAEIRYTTDGSVPTTSSTLYGGPVEFTKMGTVSLKAIAVLGGTPSGAVSVKVSVPQTGAPAVYPLGGTVKDGTVVTLRSDTAGSSIYYTLNGEDPAFNEDGSCKPDTFLYGGAIVLHNDAKLRAVAVKDGYRNSAYTKADYTVEKAERPADEVTVSLGSVSAPAGTAVSVPLYLFSDHDISGFKIALRFDKESFENYITITAGDGIDARNLFSSVSGDVVTLLYTGTSFESGGEVCTVNFTSLASKAGETCEIAVLAEESSVSTGAGSTVKLSAMNGNIQLKTAELPAQVSGQVSYTTTGGKDLTKAEETKGETEIEASFSVSETVDITGNVYLVIYDRDGQMVSVDTWQVNLSDPAFMFIQTIKIPPDVEVGAIKIMLLSDQMVPLMAASQLAG